MGTGKTPVPTYIIRRSLAEEVGFEPTVPFRAHAISSRAH